MPNDEYLDIGAGWKKTTKAGQPMISVSLKTEALKKALELAGDVEKISAIMLENKKTKDTQPDYRISVKVDLPF